MSGLYRLIPVVGLVMLARTRRFGGVSQLF
jgi:hypothetical protein